MHRTTASSRAAQRRFQRMLLASTFALGTPAAAAAQAMAAPLASYLGALGGYQAVPHAVNAWGVVVGWAETPRAARHAFVKRGDEPMRDVAGEPGSGAREYAVAHDVNDAGMVVGVFSWPQSPVLTYVFVWSPDTGLKLLPRLASWTDLSGPFRIDGRGNVLYTAQIAAQRVPMVMNPGTTQYVRLLGLPGGRDAQPMAVSEAGVVVGGAYDARGRLRPVYWDAATYALRELPPPEGTDPETFEARATGINDRGTIVGHTAQLPMRAIAWTGAELRARDVGEGQPTAVNNHDVIVGDYPSSLVPNRVRARAWDLRTGETLDLTDPDAVDQWSYATGIDDDGVVVGFVQRKSDVYQQRAARFFLPQR